LSKVINSQIFAIFLSGFYKSFLLFFSKFRLAFSFTFSAAVLQLRKWHVRHFIFLYIS